MSSIDTSSINRNICGGIRRHDRGFRWPWEVYASLPNNWQKAWYVFICLCAVGIIIGFIIGIIYSVNSKLITGFTTKSEPEDEN